MGKPVWVQPKGWIAMARSLLYFTKLPPFKNPLELMNKKQLFSDGTVFSEKTERIGKKVIYGIAILFIFLVILFMFLDDTEPASYAVDRVPASAITTEKINPINIKVTSQIVKKVEDKYRYFFDIRNYDSDPFTGTVKIELYNKDSNLVTKDLFTTNSPIEPNIGKSVYLDAYTGTSEIHGDAGVTNFSFEVVKNDSVVASGNGDIN